jgi:hypothetical protein
VAVEGAAAERAAAVSALAEGLVLELRALPAKW